MSSSSSLRDFLRSSKQQLHDSQKNKTPIVLVMGNDKADVDTIAATILFSYFRSQSGTSSTPYIPLIQTSRSSLTSILHLAKTLPHIGLEAADLLVLDDMSLDGKQSHLSVDTTRFFLINWNELTGRQGEDFSKNIEGCIDIHSDSGYVPKSTNDVRMIGRAGSCTSLVVNAVRSEWERSGNSSSSKHLASLGLAGVLVPTKDLKSGATQEDESAYEFLSGKYGSDYNRNNFYTGIVGGGDSVPTTTSTTSASREPPSYSSFSSPNQATGAGIGSIDQARTASGPPTSKIPEGDVHKTFTGNRLDPMANETVASYHEEVLPEHVHGSTGVKLTGTTVGGDGYGSASSTSGAGYGSSTSGTGYGSSTSGTGYGSSTSGTTGQSFTEKAASAVGLGSSTSGSGYDSTTGTTGSGYGSNEYSTSSTSGTTGPSFTEKAAAAVGLGSSTTGSGYGSTSNTASSGYGSNDYSSTSGTAGQSLSDKMASSTIGDNTSSTSGDYSSSSRSYAPGTTSSTTTSHDGTSASSGGFMSGVLGALGLGGHSSDNAATTGTSGTSYEGEGVGQKTSLTSGSSTTQGTGHLGSDSSNYGSSTSGQGLSGGYLSSSTPDYSSSTTRESSSRDAGLDSHETSTGHHGSSTSGVAGTSSSRYGNTSSSGHGLESHDTSTGNYGSSTSGQGASSYDDSRSSGHGLDSHESSAGIGSSSQTGHGGQSVKDQLVGDAQYAGEREGTGNGITDSGNGGTMRS